MRVATWNLAHRQAQLEATRRLAEELEIDVALLQEARRDRVAGAWSSVAMHPTEIGGGRRWASAVAARGLSLSPLTEAKPRWANRPLPLDATFPGSVAVARAETSIGPVAFVSLYAVNLENWANSILHKQLSDLTSLLWSKEYRGRVLLGGDFNGGIQYDKFVPRLWENLMQRLEVLGLVNLLDRFRDRNGPSECPCPVPGCGHVRTFRRMNAFPAEIDFLFAGASLAERVTDCWVEESLNSDWELSDHRPVVCELADVV